MEAKKDLTPNEEPVKEAEPVQNEAEVQAETQTETQTEKGANDSPSQEEWAQALKKTVEERDSYKDSWMRTQAEFQNFKRRNATLRADSIEDGSREAIAATLPAIDNLELALKHAEASGETGAMYEGVKMTLKLLTDALGKLGLEEVAAEGQEFDPEKHNAVMRAPGGQENMIAEVFQKGYKVHDKMIRYAMVKVYSGEEA